MFTKNKSPFLKDIIPDGYVDIHSHLLPGIDDGAKDINDTIYLLSELKKIGFSEFITTPHVLDEVWNNSKEIIENTLETTLKSIETCSLKCAAEYMMDNSFLKLFSEEKLLTLKENYVLVEMSYRIAPLNLFDILFELQIAGYKPILAHPERYNFYGFDVSVFKNLKRVGCLFQLNLLSSVGYYGEGIAKKADFLLQNGLIDFVGSDVHHSKHIASFNNKIVLKNHLVLKEVIQNNSFFKS